MKRHVGRTIVAAILAIGGFNLTAVRAGDPGDLFPSVGYEQAIENPGSSTASASGSSAAPARAGHAIDTESSAPASPPDSAVPAVEAPAIAGSKPKPPVYSVSPSPVPSTFWSPYAARLLVPLLSPAERMAFHQSYGEILANANASNDTRVTAAEMLAKAAAPGNAMDASLRRYLLFEALTLAARGRASVETRESLASQFLPLVEGDHTLPATQAKVTALETLANSGSADTPASPKLLDFAAQADADLALAQIETGYPVQAQLSLKKANTWLLKMARIAAPDASRLAQFAVVQFWMNRAQAAKLLAPVLKLTLIETPDDPSANTQLAALHLSLFADINKAAACAAKSDKPEFQALAKFVASLDGGVGSVDPSTPPGLGLSLDLCQTLLNVTPACPDAFDRFAIATYVKGQADELMRKCKPKPGSDPWVRLQTIQSNAQTIITANPPPAIALPPTTTVVHRTSRRVTVQ